MDTLPSLGERKRTLGADCGDVPEPGRHKHCRYEYSQGPQCGPPEPGASVVVDADDSDADDELADVLLSRPIVTIG